MYILATVSPYCVELQQALQELSMQARAESGEAIHDSAPLTD